MHPLLAALDTGSLTALQIFAGAGIIIALALIGAGLTARKKDHQAARFYFIAAAVCGGVAILLAIVSLLT